MKKAVIVLLVFLLCTLSVLPCAGAEKADTVAYTGDPVKAQSFVLTDASSGNILYSKESDLKIYPASTTKIMTAILAIESEKLDDIITITPEGSESAFSKSSSLMHLKKGEKISLMDLVHGILIVSGNEAAVSVAIAVSGSVESFVKKMNDKAEELGMTKTHFVTPHGLQNEQHYSTASDMAKLARYAMQNETFASIVKKQKYTTSSSIAGSTAHELDNTNKLILSSADNSQYYYEYATGVKTGLTPTANGCLVASAKKDQTSLIVTIFNDGDGVGNKRWEYAKDLFDFGFTNFHAVDLSGILASINLDSVQIENAAATDSLGGKLALEAVIDSSSTTGVLDAVAAKATANPEKVTVKVEYSKALKAPIAKGEILGTATATIDGDYLGKFSVAAARDVQANDPLKTSALPIVSVSPDIAVEHNANKRSVLLWPFIILAVLLFAGFLWLRGRKRKRLISRKKRSYSPASQPYTRSRTTVYRRKKKKKK
ncbi:MAG: D-alanyl-D-alanine carboxypeptidase family protein [Christensenellales bacterium]